MGKKEETQGANGVVAISKDLVRKTRQWTTKMRESTWSSWMSMMEENGAPMMMFRPWLDMTRATQDMWLETYERQACYAIDTTAQTLERARSLQNASR